MRPSRGLTSEGATLRGLGLALAGSTLVRLISLALYPLSDATESRYAEMARKMWELGDWVTPWFDYGQPFWGKPPMNTWVSAASMGLFGINEWAARLPHFVAALLVGWLVWDWLRPREARLAWWSLALLWGSVAFYVAAGAVMTDMLLLISTTLAMRGFWMALQTDEARSVREGWLLFVGMALGLLAKGPIALILVGLPLGGWVLISGRWRDCWRRLPWLRGTALMLALSVPWYVLAERKTPGFLNYFLLGEHWYRFTVPGWSGDLYGRAHLQARGMIWLYGLLACLPWLLLLPAMMWRRRQFLLAPPPFEAQRDWRNYLLLWMLAPCLFFTVSRNILWTYVLPGLPALAIFCAIWLSADARVARTQRLLAIGLWMTTLGLVGVLTSAHLTQQFNSARAVVDHFHEYAVPDDRLLVVDRYPFSGAFYTRGRAPNVDSVAALEQRLQEAKPPAGPQFVALSSGFWDRLPPELLAQLELRGQFDNYRLYAVRR